MNIKIGDLLFEENNSNEIHETFKSLIKEEEENKENSSEDKSEKNKSPESEDKILNQQKIGVVDSKVSSFLSGKFPDAKKYLSGDKKLSDTLATLKTAQGKEFLGHGLNIFNLKNVKGNPDETPDVGSSDLNIYGKSGFVIFELVSKEGEIGGQSAQGNKIAVYFAMALPGFRCKVGTKLYELHKSLFKLEIDKESEEKAKDSKDFLVHAGLNKVFPVVPLQDNDTNISNLRKAIISVSSGNVTQFATIMKASKTGANKPVKTESFVHNSSLTELLFEKKSKRKLKTNEKKSLVENYFNVNYSELNNYQKRDYYYFSSILLEIDNKNIITEEAEQYTSDEYHNMPPINSKAAEEISTDPEKRKSWFSRLKKLIQT